MDPDRIIRRSTSVFLAATVGVYAILAFIWTLTADLTTGLIFSAFVTIPAAILGWSILSLVLYLRAKKRGDNDLPDLRSRMRVATGLLIFLAVMIALLIAFFSCAISHM